MTAPGTRVPPHNKDAEEAFLGAALGSSSVTVIADGIEAGLQPSDFYVTANQEIWAAILKNNQDGHPIDRATVADTLQRNGMLDLVGGLNTLGRYIANTPAFANAARYARIIAEHSMMRRMIAECGDVIDLCYSQPDDPDEVVEEAEKRIAALLTTHDRNPTVALHEAAERHYDLLHALVHPSDDAERIKVTPTGFKSIDNALNGGLRPSQFIILGARPAQGKALSLDTPLPTPTGWTTMGEAQVGDQLLDEHGQPCHVTAVSTVQTQRPCYRVEFDDGSVLVADAEHQWFAYDAPAWKSLRNRAYAERSRNVRYPSLARPQTTKEPRVVTTRQMLDEGVRHKSNRPNWYLPLAAPFDPPEADLPVDPYVLGCWLGDGTTANARMTIGDEDTEHFTAEFENAGYCLSPRHGMTYATQPVPGTGMWQSYDGDKRVLSRELRAVGLLGGSKKHIPEQYQRASYKQRLALLQGLMDTDGSVVNGTVELGLSNLPLLEQAHEMVASLGHKPNPIHQREIPLPDGRTATAWRFVWTPLCPVFRMERKMVRFSDEVSSRQFGRGTRRAVTSITQVPSVPVKCVMVDSPNHLYLAGKTFIPTHNSALAGQATLNIVVETERPCLFFSLEMTETDLTERYVAGATKIPLSDLRQGRLTEEQLDLVSDAAKKFREAPLFINDASNQTISSIRQEARRFKALHGDLAGIAIDYLQLMQIDDVRGGGNRSRQEDVSGVSRGCKLLGRELDMWVLALSQLSRKLEEREDKRPKLADLRESGSLEQDADIVLFVYRDDMYHPDSADIGTGEIIIAKHRAGKTGTVKLAFLDRFTLFADMPGTSDSPADPDEF